MLWIGFSALLFLMVAIAIVADRTLKQIQAGSAALRSELLLRRGLIDRLRLGLYRSSTYVTTQSIPIPRKRAAAESWSAAE